MQWRLDSFRTSMKTANRPETHEIRRNEDAEPEWKYSKIKEKHCKPKTAENVLATCEKDSYSPWALYCSNAFCMSAGTCSSLLQPSSLLGNCLWQAPMRRLPWSVSWRLRTVQTFTTWLNHLHPKGPKGTTLTGSFAADICHDLWGSKLIAGPSFRFADLSAEGAYQSNGATVRANEDAWGRSVPAFVGKMIKTLGMIENQPAQILSNNY